MNGSPRFGRHAVSRIQFPMIQHGDDLSASTRTDFLRFSPRAPKRPKLIWFAAMALFLAAVVTLGSSL